MKDPEERAEERSFAVERFGERGLRFERPAVPARALERALLARGAIDVVIAETHVLALFPTPSFDGRAVRLAVDEARSTPPDALAPRTFELAVRYDGADLEAIGEAIGASPDEVVALHAEAAYDVKMMGFLPGFAYLGELHPRLRLPRRPSPRPRVPPFSVAIAGPSSAVYPFASPGGWHLLGTAAPFDAFSISLGDRVRFVPRR